MQTPVSTKLDHHLNENGLQAINHAMLLLVPKKAIVKSSSCGEKDEHRVEEDQAANSDKPNIYNQQMFLPSSVIRPTSMLAGLFNFSCTAVR